MLGELSGADICNVSHVPSLDVSHAHMKQHSKSTTWPILDFCGGGLLTVLNLKVSHQCRNLIKCRGMRAVLVYVGVDAPCLP